MASNAMVADHLKHRAIDPVALFCDLQSPVDPVDPSSPVDPSVLWPPILAPVALPVISRAALSIR